jgi:hypothetical protein
VEELMAVKHVTEESFEATVREGIILLQDGATIVYRLRSARYQFKYYGVL